MFQVRAPPLPPHGHGFPFPPVDVGAAGIVWLPLPPLWMWVPPVDVSPVRGVWFAPLPLWMWVLFAPYTKFGNTSSSPYRKALPSLKR